MKISETTLSFLEKDCVQILGVEKGSAIFQKTEEIYQELLCTADYKNSTAIKNHLQLKLFPPLAYYKALRESGILKESALEYVRQETQKAAQLKRDEMKQIANMPFAYMIYRCV